MKKRIIALALVVVLAAGGIPGSKIFADETKMTATEAVTETAETEDTQNASVTKADDLETLADEVTPLIADTVSETEKKDSLQQQTLIVQSENTVTSLLATQIIQYDNLYVLSYDDAAKAKKDYEQFLTRTDIDFVELDTVMETAAETEEASGQKTVSGQSDSAFTDYINSLDKKQEVTVAVVDTGINTDSEALENRIAESSYNFSGSNAKDENGHGTKIACAIAAVTPDTVKILPVKVTNKDGRSTVLAAYLGIKSAIEAGAQVINLSMNAASAADSSGLLQSVLDEANEKGIYVVVSAGNDGTDTKDVIPSNIDSAIVVSAVDDNGKIADYSNYGDTVDYAAYGTYGSDTGTSYAAAYVSGAVAALVSGGITDVTDTLNRYALDFGDVGKDRYNGNGFIGNEKISNGSKNNTTVIDSEETDTESQNTEEVESEDIPVIVDLSGGTDDILSVSATGLTLKYEVQLSNVGWPSSYTSDNAWSGNTSTSNTNERIEAIKIVLTNSTGISGGIKYRVHQTSGAWTGTVFDADAGLTPSGWSSWKTTNGSQAGVTGTGQHLEAITIRLTGDLSNYYYASYYVRTTKTPSGAATTSAPKSYRWHDFGVDDATFLALNPSWNPDSKYDQTWDFAGTYMYTLPIEAMKATIKNRKVTYTVVPNGGIWNSTTANTSATMNAGGTVMIAKPTRTGYTFSSWTISQSDATQSTANGYQPVTSQVNGSMNDTTGVLTAGNRDITLTAAWTPYTYTVNYNGNESTSGSMSSSTHTYDTAKNLTANKFSRAYTATFDANGGVCTSDPLTDTYTFKNWNTKADGSGTEYADMASVLNLSAENGALVNLYAQWTAGTITLPTATKKGYELLGWNTSSTATTAKTGFTPGANVTLSADTTLYAVWKLKTMPIYYNANGGTGTMADGVKTWGENYTISQNVFTREGYEFLGWSTDQATAEATYQSGDSYSNQTEADYDSGKGITFYAVWQGNIAPDFIGLDDDKADIADTGENATGYEVSSGISYTMNDNLDEATGEDYFEKSESETFTDELSGEEVTEQIQSTVVGWKFGNNSQSVIDFSLGQTVTTEKLLKLATDANAITSGAPNTDFKYAVAEPMTSSLVKAMSINRAMSLFYSSSGASSTALRYINLYAKYDKGAVIYAQDLYYTLDAAQSGAITEEELLSRAKACDEELVSEDNPKGLVAKGIDSKAGTTFDVLDYTPADFTFFTGTGSVSETFRVIDSVGNVTKRQITVHIVDTTPVDADPKTGKARFISAKYFLSTMDADSIWLTDPEYKEELEEVLSNERVDQELSDPITGVSDELRVIKPGSGHWKTEPEQIWQFSSEDVQRVKDYVDEHGIGNLLEDDALANFVVEFEDNRVK